MGNAVYSVVFIKDALSVNAVYSFVFVKDGSSGKCCV